MLRATLLSLFWAVCSTCLVRPWFWEGVIKKDLFNHDGEKIGFSDNWKFELIVEITCFVFTFALSMYVYLGSGYRYNIYGSFQMIILCLLVQCLWQYQGKIRYRIFLFMAVFFVFSWIQDGIVSLNISIPLKNTVESIELTALSTQEDEDSTQIKFFVSADEIKNLFKATSASGPTYNNGKFIFTVNGGENGYGIVIIDKNNYSKAYFISCLYKFSVKSVRSKCPTQKLKKLYITVSDNNVPYGLFAVADKDWFLGSYRVNTYLLFNLTNGEAQMFTQEQLPSFVTDN